MKDVYEVAGISKQGHYKALSRKAAELDRVQELEAQLKAIRKKHKRMGLRKLYFELDPEGIGRDKFEALMAERGHKLEPVKSFTRTTYAHPSSKYPNLISGKKLDGPNQLWVSDITYVRVGAKFCYLTLIMDVYTRKIVGWSLDKTLAAESNMRALKMAFRTRRGADLSKLIHHSDRGGQFVYRKYIRALKRRKIKVSMGNKAWENAHAERINGIIKLEYIEPEDPQTWGELVRVTSRAIVLYNTERPHGSLNRMSPNEFEKHVSGLAPKRAEKYLIKY